LYVRASSLRVDLGRWMSTDPAWPLQQAYEYAVSSPASFIDASGLGPSGGSSPPCYPPRSECSGQHGGGNVSSSYSRYSDVHTSTFTGIEVTVSSTGSLSGGLPIISGTVSATLAGKWNCEVIFTHGDVITRSCVYDCICHGCRACPDEGYCMWRLRKDQTCKGNFTKSLLVCPGWQYLLGTTFTPFPDQPPGC